jgi:hypothetical protein
MKIAAICSTKNEGDIVESFVRLNARICTSFFFADDSTDHTRAILTRLGGEGYDINLLPRLVSEGAHNQPAASQRYLSHVAEVMAPDWIFFLDADEIIAADDRDRVIAEMQAAGPAGYLAAEWRTFVPVTLDYFKSHSPLSECFAPRREEGARYRKVSLPGRLARSVETTAGNHGLRSLTGAPLQEQLAQSYYLAHFPVRSAEQLIVKNVIATHNLAARVDAEDGEGHHVLPVLQTIRRKGYRLTLQDLVALASGYALDERAPVPPPALPAAARDPRFETTLKYRDLAEIDVLARLDAELQRYAGELKRARKSATALKLETVRLQFHTPAPISSTRRR